MKDQSALFSVRDIAVDNITSIALRFSGKVQKYLKEVSWGNIQWHLKHGKSIVTLIFYAFTVRAKIINLSVAFAWDKELMFRKWDKRSWEKSERKLSVKTKILYISVVFLIQSAVDSTISNVCFLKNSKESLQIILERQFGRSKKLLLTLDVLLTTVTLAMDQRLSTWKSSVLVA